jgi:hypothetical protein
MILFINLSGDMEDLANVFGEDIPADSSFDRKGRCSALLRVGPDTKDVFIAKATWSLLNSMLRMYKLYHFPYPLDGSSGDRVPTALTSLSSSPGVMCSGDDFYLLSSGMVVQETTIGVWIACLFIITVLITAGYQGPT